MIPLEEFEYTYDCELCGAQCCRNWNPAQYDPNLVNDDGICIYLNPTTNLCSIYEYRPDFCRVNVWYEKMYSKKMSLNQFIECQKLGCDILKQLGTEIN